MTRAHFARDRVTVALIATRARELDHTSTFPHHDDHHDEINLILPMADGPEIPHGCLRVPEIQALIFSSLSTQDCSKVARTCAAFYEQAMNVVWADVKSLIPFLLCMPSGTLSLETKKCRLLGSDKVEFNFTRTLDPSDWQCFCKHAHRVKRYTDETFSPCSHPSFSAYQLAPDAVRIITEFVIRRNTQDTAGPLFPALRSLTFCTEITSDQWIPTCLPHICGQTLQSLTFEVSRGILPRRAAESVPDVCKEWSQSLPAMYAAWPSVRYIHFVHFYLEEARVSPFTGWLGNFKHLHTLEAPVPLNTSLLLELSTLPFLHTLKFSDVDKATDHTPFPQLSSTCFPSLGKLYLSNREQSLTIPFLQALAGSRTLTHVDIITLDVSDLSVYSTELSPLCEAISHISSITALRITLLTSLSRAMDTSASTDFSRELLSKLFSLRRMQDFRVSGNFAFRTIQDRNLHLAAIAWPRLEAFTLSSMFDYSSPWTTLVGVQALYNGCPSLKRVELTANCTLPYLGNPHVARAFLGTPSITDKPRDVSMEYLHLKMDDSNPISTPHYLALVIRLIFPLLRDFEAYFAWDIAPEWNDRVKECWERYQYLEKSQIVALLDGMDPFEDSDEEDPYLDDSNSEPEDVDEDESSSEVGDPEEAESESGDESGGSDSQGSTPEPEGSYSEEEDM